MAIISIPTSVAGISIPGKVINGPLSKLYQSKYNHTFLKYPRDLESSGKGHVIEFTIEEIQPIEISAKTVGDVAKTVGDASVEKLKEGFNKAIEANKNGLNITPRKTKTVATIHLYIPDTVNFTYNASFDSVSVTDVAQKLMGTIPTAGKKTGALAKFGSKLMGAVSSLASTGLPTLATRALGYAVNPQQQLLFNGIDLRNFSFAFTFTPYSQQESKDVEQIIQLLKEHSRPKLIEGTAGMFFTPPSVLKVKFLFNGKENTHIGKIAECFIEGIDINYAPNGWAAHTDGSPVQTSLLLNLRETTIVDRNMVNKGY